MPAEELAPCGFGAFGTCCCTCAYHAKTVLPCNKHQGGHGECPPSSQKTGYACVLFFDSKRESPIVIEWREHGMCEGYAARELKS